MRIGWWPRTEYLGREPDTHVVTANYTLRDWRKSWNGHEVLIIPSRKEWNGATIVRGYTQSVQVDQEPVPEMASGESSSPYNLRSTVLYAVNRGS